METPRCRIKRRWPAVEFAYAVVVERTVAGFPHFHVACRAPFIPQGWLSDAWAELVGAPVVDIRAVRTQEGLAAYLAKYLAKDPTKIGSGKRYWFSQGYRHDDATGRPIARWSWSREHITRTVVDLAGRTFLPHWLNPQKCVLYQMGAP